MDILHKNVVNFFEEILINFKCHSDTKAYILGIYGKYKTIDFDLSKDSVTLLFSQAQDKKDFFIYQNLGDWIFYTKSIFPEYLKEASEEYYNNIARLSYYNCYRIMKTWKVYEQLADEFPLLVGAIRNIIKF